MRRILAFLRTWAVPALFVLLAALLTVPWTFWVVFAAYERDVNEKTQMLSQRVRVHLDTYEAYERDLNRQQLQFTELAQRLGFRVAQPQGPSFQSDRILDPLKAELLGDKTVQAVVFLDYGRQRGGFVRLNEGIPIPRSMEDVGRMINADPGSYRKSFPLRSSKGNVSGVVYIDLSRRELWNHFWEADGPLLWRVAFQTAVAIVVLAAAGIIAWRLWGSAHRQRLRAELEQQGLLAERGLTAAVLAHEIRNPLQALRFQLSSLRRRAADNERVAATADTIDAELSRIQRLVQDYLAHEKAQNMRVQPVELMDAVTGLQTLMDEFLRDRGTRLLVQRHAPVTVACDPHALRQVLMNLVLNAQQAMGYGGTITISLGQDNGFGTISVADNGPGIPADMKERLFKPFATNKKEGSGIGLALVKRFVDNFGGSVAVDSEAGRGTAFHLRLPLASTENAEAPVVLQYDSRHRPAAQ